jgi:hypothetical protein
MAEIDDLIGVLYAKCEGLIQSHTNNLDKFKVQDAQLRMDLMAVRTYIRATFPQTVPRDRMLDMIQQAIVSIDNRVGPSIMRDYANDPMIIELDLLRRELRRAAQQVHEIAPGALPTGPRVNVTSTPANPIPLTTQMRVRFINWWDRSRINMGNVIRAGARLTSAALGTTNAFNRLRRIVGGVMRTDVQTLSVVRSKIQQAQLSLSEKTGKIKEQIQEVQAILVQARNFQQVTGP